jgi:hypothetical protein
LLTPHSRSESIGFFRVAIPTNLPRLDIAIVYNRIIDPDDDPGPVTIVLSPDAPASDFITVYARNLTAPATVHLALTPESGDRTRRLSEVSHASS